MSKVYSLTRLCEMNGSDLDARIINKALLKAGVLKEVEYQSTTGSGEWKSYLVISDQYSFLGVNRSTPHEFRTQAVYYKDSFDHIERITLRSLTSKKISSVDIDGDSEVGAWLFTIALVIGFLIWLKW